MNQKDKDKESRHFTHEMRDLINRGARLRSAHNGESFPDAVTVVMCEIAAHIIGEIANRTEPAEAAVRIASIIQEGTRRYGHEVDVVLRWKLPREEELKGMVKGGSA